MHKLRRVVTNLNLIKQPISASEKHPLHNQDNNILVDII